MKDSIGNLEEYRDALLLAFRQNADNTIAALREALRKEFQAEFERSLARVERGISEARERAITDFDRQMAEVKKMKEQGHNEVLLGHYEQSIKRGLGTTLKGLQSLLEGFISSCQSLLR